MRNSVFKYLSKLFKRKRFVFFTGDVGYNALEPLREMMGPYFFNAGIAEQNMVSMAAGVAIEGLGVWVYSIAPFCYARPFEQIRNDICLNNLPVKLIGNGGGYAYGHNGATHHAIDDYGSLLTLQNCCVYIPVFEEDIEAQLSKIVESNHPTYLRLGRCECPAGYEPPPYQPWRKLIEGKGPVLLAVGPIVGGYIKRFLECEVWQRPEIWALAELPIKPGEPPDEFLACVTEKDQLVVAEEHVAQGGAGSIIAQYLLSLGVHPKVFKHIYALGYPTGTYGSQKFHRKQCRLDAESIATLINKLKCDAG